MITSISVKNYALIKALNLDLKDGFTTITGETGAGKSILLGALGLVLGNRAESKVLGDEKVKCIVEANFNIEKLALQGFFEEQELDYEATSILRREILPSGKSRAFINDTPVKLETLKELGNRLVDIHSQHDSMLMLNASFQLSMLDAIAQNQKERSAYQRSFEGYQTLKKEYNDLQKKLAVDIDTDYIQFLVDELEKAKIVVDEEFSLDEELKVLRHAEDIQSGLSLGLQNLQEEFGVLSKLHESVKSVELAARFLPPLDSLTQRLHSSEIELKDISSELERQLEDVQLDENRLNELEERQNVVLQLMQKHRVTSTQELLEKYNELSDQLFLATTGVVALQKKEKEIAVKFEELKKESQLVSKTRKATAQILQIDAQQYLNRLKMPNAELRISIVEQDKAMASGFDDVEFLFSANKGSKPQPIHKVASGGELSRVMLSLKAILAKTQSLPAIIFDEIDTGISGETAQRAAQILGEMGENMQVLAITHLPQIAAHGAQHLKVSKSSSAQSTETRLTYLTKTERVEEIARLLSGASISEAARKTAEELLVG